MATISRYSLDKIDIHGEIRTRAAKSAVTRLAEFNCSQIDVSILGYCQLYYYYFGHFPTMRRPYANICDCVTVNPEYSF